MSENRPSSRPGIAWLPASLPGRLLAAAAVLQVPVALCVLLVDQETFARVFLTADSYSYLQVVTEFLSTGTLRELPLRTLGYPIYLLIHCSIFGEDFGLRVAIVTQLAMNLVFVLVVWSLLKRLCNDVDEKIRLFAAGLAWLAGLDLACLLLTDSIAALLFAIAVYVVLFSTRPVLFLLAAICMFLAGQCRPVINFAVLIIPVLFLFRKKFLAPVRGWLVLLVASGAILSWAVETTAEHMHRNDPTVESLRTFDYRIMIDVQFYANQFKYNIGPINAECSSGKGKEYSQMTRGEKEATIRDCWVSKVMKEPHIPIMRVGKQFVMYLFAPLELGMLKTMAIFNIEWPPIRLILGLLFLPVWLLSYIPFVRKSRHRRAWWLVSLCSVAILLGLGSIIPSEGERYRLPVLLFVWPLFCWNSQLILESFRSGRGRLVTTGPGNDETHSSQSKK